MKKSLQLAQEYFLKSKERGIALLLLLGAAITTVGFVAFISCISWWSAGFWAALAAMNISMFMNQLLLFAGIIVGIVTSTYLNNLITDYLAARWRNWLTKRLLKDYVPIEHDDHPIDSEKNSFIDLLRFPKQIPNPQQRIQEDVDTYVNNSLSLSMGLLRSVLQLSCSIGALWIIGGSFSFLAFGSLITIPGFLVWAALLFSTTASMLTYFIGKHLSKVNQQQEAKEAELRQELELLSQQSEFIGQEHGQAYYQTILQKKMDELTEISTEKLTLNARISAFQNLYKNLAYIFPNLAAAPLYFKGLIDLGTFMQVAVAFSQVNSALDWFVDSYRQLASYHASVERLTQLEKSMSPKGLNSAPKQIEFAVQGQANEIKLKQVNVSFPENSKLLFENLNLTIKPKENTLIEGDNGTGKSTLFKVMAGTWRYGTGDISIPKNVMFFSQRPTIPRNTLRTVLAYPQRPDRFSNEAYQQALAKVGLEKYSAQLDENKLDWGKTLSLGEQQKVGFARALLNKPQWLFLDEATASLTEENETKMYQEMERSLPDTTLISIGHRPGIKRFHPRILFFKKSPEHQVAFVASDTKCNNALEAQEVWV